MLEKLEKKTRELGKKVDRKIPPGAIVEAYVDGVALAGLALSMKKRDKAPVVAALLGLTTAAIGNTMGSVVGHRIPHKSVDVKPKALVGLRVVNTLTSGSLPDTFTAMHRVHHANADGPNDPHGPNRFGRWGVIFGLPVLAKNFKNEHPELVVAEQDDIRTRHLPFENYTVTTASVAATHWFVGEKLGLPPTYRLASALIQTAGMYIARAAFTGDSHPYGEPLDLKLSPQASIIMGGETDHAHHHEAPWDARHAAVDPGYMLIKGLQAVKVASIPAEQAVLQ